MKYSVAQRGSIKTYPILLVSKITAEASDASEYVGIDLRTNLLFLPVKF